MNLLEMSFAGGVLILAVIVLRSLTLNKLPKGTFLALWAVAALRLLVPFTIPSPASVYTLAEPVVETLTVPTPPTAPAVSPLSVIPETIPVPEATPSVDVWPAVWCIGMLVCGAFFLLSYFRCRREFRTALPVEDPGLEAWLKAQKLRRTVSLRQSDRVDAPLTYGLLRPVILLPKTWTDNAQMEYALIHELSHIRHLDALWKPILALTACVHWFNPLVWCMFLLANRDMELRCDEDVVRRMGLEYRSGYALALISLAEKKSGLGPFASAFSKNAIEERILAIMKLKKRSLAAILAAVVLVGCIGVAFATSAAEKAPDAPYPTARDGFTEQELDRLASLWFEGWEDMTVTDYQQKMWTETDTPEMIALIDRYANSGESSGSEFDDYFYQVFSPLTASSWRERTFPGEARVRTADGGSALVEFNYTMRILDPDRLTAGDYQKRLAGTEASMEKTAQLNPSEDQLQRTYMMMTSTEYSGALETVISDCSVNFDLSGIPDADLDYYIQSSRESAAEWDRVLSPYAPLGLTWKFDDPDLDGNGLTMWFQGKEVRGIMDGQEGIWITEHTGNSAYSEGAVELYTVYTDGVLTGLRFASPEEQAAFDADRNGVSATIPVGAATLQAPEEQREFPRATLEDYDALLTLRTAGYDALSLEDFNQRLLDWANENAGAWNRINCDVIWNDYDKELTTDAKTFASLTCRFSGTENGQKVRALHTGNPEEDPHFSASMPERFVEENGVRTAWCDLYYDISYHVADKSAVTVAERDACMLHMLSAIGYFWQDTDLDTLLTMTEEDVVSWLNAWAAEASTENIRFNTITADGIHFEAYDERGID